MQKALGNALKFIAFHPEGQEKVDPLQLFSVTVFCMRSTQGPHCVLYGVCTGPVQGLHSVLKRVCAGSALCFVWCLVWGPHSVCTGSAQYFVWGLHMKRDLDYFRK